MSKSYKFAFVISQLTLAIILSTGCGDDDPTVIPGTPDSGITLPGADAAVESCDTVAQDCEADTDKCSVNVAIDGSNQAVWSTTCRAVTGTVELGVLCLRNPSEGNDGVGKDDCAKGLYCTARGNPDGDVTAAARVCRQFCQSTAGCTGGGANFTCMQLTTNLSPATGICIDSCEPLGAGICTDGAWCSPQEDIQGTTRGECTEPGEAAEGSECNADTGCVANSICVTTAMASVCRNVCDLAATPEYPCAQGSTCMAIGGFPADYGVCIPN